MNRRFAAIVAVPVLALGTTFALASPASAVDLKNCGDFTYQEDAQDWLDAHPGDPDNLDRDNNGIACESLPHRPAGPATQHPVPVPTICVSPTPTVTPTPTPTPTVPPTVEPTPTASPEPTEEPKPTDTPAPKVPSKHKPKHKPAEVPAVPVIPEADEPIVIEVPETTVTPSVESESAGEGGGVPVPCAPPAEGGGADSGGLPVTGASLTTVLVGGLLMLMIGIGAVFVGRRRRSLA